MSSEQTVEINMKMLFKSKLSIESYCILLWLVRSHKDMIESYVKSYGKVDMFRFEELVKLGYIEIIDKNNLTFDNIRVTEAGIEVIGIEKLDHVRMFKELKEVYPKKGGLRGLHTDLARCQKIYKELITSEEMHKKILNCIRLHVKQTKQAGKMEFLQALPAFLHQRNYEQYLDDIGDNDDEVSSDVRVNIDGI